MVYFFSFFYGFHGALWFHLPLDKSN